VVERRYLSLRETRSSRGPVMSLSLKGEDAAAAIGSVGIRGAEQDCAALLMERDMVVVGAFGGTQQWERVRGGDGDGGGGGDVCSWCRTWTEIYVISRVSLPLQPGRGRPEKVGNSRWRTRDSSSHGPGQQPITCQIQRDRRKSQRLGVRYSVLTLPPFGICFTSTATYTNIFFIDKARRDFLGEPREILSRPARTSQLPQYGP
jgi:hypothetical protein